MSGSTAKFVFADGIARESVEPGIERQLLGIQDALMMVRVWFEEGAVGALHRHPHAQICYVESGEFDVTVEDQTERLVAGDCYNVTSNLEHGVRCVSAGVLLDVFSPMRADFLEQYK